MQYRKPLLACPTASEWSLTQLEGEDLCFEGGSAPCALIGLFPTVRPGLTDKLNGESSTLHKHSHTLNIRTYSSESSSPVLAYFSSGDL